MLALVLFLSALPAILTTHLIYTDPSVALDTAPILGLLEVAETVTLKNPVYLESNRKYGITFKFHSDVVRTYRGASGSSSQSSLYLDRTNSSWVLPSTLSPFANNWNFYFKPNIGAASPNPTGNYQFDTSGSNIGGFGQTWHSGAGGMLTQFDLKIPGLMTSNAVVATMNIYDLSAFANNPHPVFPYWQETFNPTKSPTTTRPSHSPTKFPTTKAPTPAFFNPPGCDSTLIPIQYQNSTVVCNQSGTTVPNITNTKIISGIVTISVVDKNGTKIVVKDLPRDRRIYFFIELTSAGQALLAKNDPCEPAPEISCAWLSGDDWLVSGCELAPELGTKNAAGSEGRYCACDHLTSFSLVLRPNSNSELCSSTRYVMAAISGTISFAALIQMARSFHALRVCGMLVNIHLAVAIAALLHMAISLLAPTLSTEPAILVFLSSIVTFIELGCYIYLVYVWIGFSGNTLNLIDKLKWPFRIFLLLTLLIAVGIPIAMISSAQATQLSLARIGSYLMCAITAILCCGLTLSGLKVRMQMIAVKSNLTAKRCSFPTRILLGSIGLGGSVLAQAAFWAASVDDTVINNGNIADGIDLGFNLAAFLTFITLLFMFFFGVADASRKSKRKSTGGSHLSRGSRSEGGSRSETMVTQGPRGVGGSVALAGVIPALPAIMPDISSLPKRRFSYYDSGGVIPDLPRTPAPPSDSPPPDYEPPDYSNEYGWDPLDKT